MVGNGGMKMTVETSGVFKINGGDKEKAEYEILAKLSWFVTREAWSKKTLD